MSHFINDIKYAIRQLRKTPVYTAIAIVSLAIGLGAGTAVFSLANGILLRALPVEHARALRMLSWEADQTNIPHYNGGLNTTDGGRQTGESFSFPFFEQLRRQAEPMADVFGHKSLFNITIRSEHSVSSSWGMMVTGNFFTGLGVKPCLGRVFTRADEATGQAPVTVISHWLWQSHYNADPNVLGQTIHYNDHAYMIVGVLPENFKGLEPEQRVLFYVSMSAHPQFASRYRLSLTSEQHCWLQMMARLQPGADDIQFQTLANAAFVPHVQTMMKTPSVTLTDGSRGSAYRRDHYRRPLLLLLVIVGVLLLVMCANLAGLSLARNMARQKEYAIRTAVGAGRWRLLRQSLTEHLLIAFVGAGLGMVLAYWAKALILNLLAGNLQPLEYNTQLDGTVICFTLLLALVTGLLSGVLPALRVSHVRCFSALKEKTAIGGHSSRWGKILVSVQIAFSLVILFAGGLYARTLFNLVHIDPGFEMDSVLLFQVSARHAQYDRNDTPLLYDKISQRLKEIPSVADVAMTQYVMLSGWSSGGGSFSLPGHSSTPQTKRLTVNESFFSTMEIPVLEGRCFRETDNQDNAKVVMVNRCFAQRYLKDEAVIGQILHADGQDWRIIGVCQDISYTGIKDEKPPTVFFSFRQHMIDATYFALRSRGNPLALVPEVRKAVRAAHAGLPITDVSTQVHMRDIKINQERLFATISGALALLAVLLACLGVYGLLSFSVRQRSNEIGIRLALGATGQRVTCAVIYGVVWITLLGLGTGAVTSLLLGRLVEGALYGVSAFDPWVLLMGMLFLLALVMSAAWIPARRAARIDPMEALRYE